MARVTSEAGDVPGIEFVAEWFLPTLKAILVPITVSRTSNLLRAIETLFGVSIAQWRYCPPSWPR